MIVRIGIDSLLELTYLVLNEANLLNLGLILKLIEELQSQSE